MDPELPGAKEQADRLGQLESLRREGVLSEEEFVAAVGRRPLFGAVWREKMRIGLG